MSLEDVLARLSGNALDALEALLALKGYIDINNVDRDACGHILDGLAPAIKDLNFKVAEGALEVLAALVYKAGDDAKPALGATLPLVVDRLGDAKQQVRHAAGQVLTALLRVLTAPVVLERLAKLGAAEHKSWRVRESVLLALAAHVQAHGLADLEPRDQERALLPLVAGRLQDAQPDVRFAAIECLAAMHAVLGEQLVHMLSAHAVRPAQMKELYARFEREAASSEASVADGRSAPAKLRSKGAVGASHGRKSVAPGRGDDGDGDEAVVPVYVTKESDLLAEMTDIARNLDAKNDWQIRTRAMRRLTGIAVGGGGMFPLFMEQLKTQLREPLIHQIMDRRSQVSRVAMACLSACAAAVGHRFEPLAVAILPEMFKVLVIAIVVMAEAADACMHRILHHCQAVRLARPIVEALISDKSAKLRFCCAGYLLEILREWPAQTYEKMMDVVQRAVKSSVTDASPETRAVARDIFCTYHSLFPDQAAQMLKTMERSTQEKLQRALADFQPPGGEARPSTASTRAPARPSLSVGARRASVAPAGQALARRATISQGATQTASNRDALDRQHGTDGPWALSAPGAQPGSGWEQPHGGAADAPSTQPSGAVNGGGDGGRPRSRRSVMPRRVHADTPAAPDAYAAAHQAPPPTPAQPQATKLADHVRLWEDAHLDGRTLDWSETVALLDSLSAWLAAATRLPPPETGAVQLSTHALSVAKLLLGSLSDTHPKVLQAGLEAFAAAFRLSPAAFDVHLADFFPHVMHLVTGPLKHLRPTAHSVAEFAAMHMPADTLVAALTRCLAQASVWRMKTNALEFFSAYIGKNTMAGTPASAHLTRAFLKEAAACMYDGNPEVRQQAQATLQHIYKQVDEDALVQFVCLHQTPPGERHTLLQLMLELMPEMAPLVTAFRLGHNRLSQVDAIASSTLQRPRGVDDGAIRHAGAHAASLHGPSSAEEHGASAPGVYKLAAADDMIARSLSDGGATPTSMSASDALPDLRAAAAGPGAASPPRLQRSSATGVLEGAREKYGHSALPDAAGSPAGGTDSSKALGWDVPVPSVAAFLGKAEQENVTVALHRLTLQLHRITNDPADSVYSLQSLSVMVDELPELAWQEKIVEVVTCLCKVLTFAYPEPVAAAIDVLAKLACIRAEMLTPQLHSVLDSVLDLFNNEMREAHPVMAKKCDDLLELELALHCNVKSLMQYYLLKLPSPAAVQVGSAVSGAKLMKVVSMCKTTMLRCKGADEAETLVCSLLPGLHAALHDGAARIRMLTTECWVAAFAVLGARLAPYMASLSTSQKRLITLYISKMQTRELGNGDVGAPLADEHSSASSALASSLTA